MYAHTFMYTQGCFNRRGGQQIEPYLKSLLAHTSPIIRIILPPLPLDAHLELPLNGTQI